jgi:hypothetical protein
MAVLCPVRCVRNREDRKQHGVRNAASGTVDPICMGDMPTEGTVGGFLSVQCSAVLCTELERLWMVEQ